MFPTTFTQLQLFDTDDGNALFPVLVGNYIYYISEHDNNIYVVDTTNGNKDIAFATNNTTSPFYRALFKTNSGYLIYIQTLYGISTTAKLWIFRENNGTLQYDDISGFEVPIDLSNDSPPAWTQYRIIPYINRNTIGLLCYTYNMRNVKYGIYNEYTITGFKSDPEYNRFIVDNAEPYMLFEYTVNDFTNGDAYYAGIYNIVDSYYINKVYRVSLSSDGFIYTDTEANILSSTLQMETTSSFMLNDDVYFNNYNGNRSIIKYNKNTNEVTETDNVISEENLNFCYNEVFAYTVSDTEIVRYKIFGNITFNIFNYKNEKVLTVSSQYPIKGLIFAKNADNITVTITTNYSRYEYTYVVVESLYKEIIGYGYGEGEEVTFIFDTTYSVDIKTNTELYEEYQVIDGTPTKFAINLYKNSAESIRVDKSNYLTSVGTLSGVLREETSLTDMSLTIQYNVVPNFNYVYIPIFNRYYYVTDVTSVRKNLWEIGLKCDVLMSYQGGIKQLHAFVDRNEFINNPEIIDKKRVIQQGVDVRSVTLENSLFTDAALLTTDECYILTGYKIGIGGTSNG